MKPLLAGLAALVLVTAAATDPRWLAAIVTPPPILRAMLVAISTVAGLALIGRALAAIDTERLTPGPSEPELRSMLRGIRLVFLAVAALAAAAGWALGHPLPLVVAVIVAAVDVVETSFLGLVVSRARRAR